MLRFVQPISKNQIITVRHTLMKGVKASIPDHIKSASLTSLSLDHAINTVFNWLIFSGEWRSVSPATELKYSLSI